MNESSQDKYLNNVAVAGHAEAELTLDYSDDDLVLINNVKVLVAPPISRLQMNIVAFCTQGRIQFDMNGKPLVFEANQILACPSNFSFSNLMMSPDFEFKALFVSNRMLQGILRARMNSWTNLLYVRKQHVATLGAEEISFLVSFYEMLRTIISSPAETPYKMEVMESLLRGGLIALLGFLLTQTENEDASFPRGRKTSEAIFQQFLDLVGNSKVKHLPVEHFARELCVTPKYLSTVCKNHSGKTANATSNVAYKGTYVTDNSGVFSDNQRMELEADATALAEQYKMGVYLLVVDYMQDSNGRDLQDPSSTQRTNFATSFYRANGLGLNKNGSSYGDGIMLVVATKSRDYVTIAYGQGSYSFSDEGIKAMEDAVTDELGNDDWYDGAEQYYSRIKEQLAYYDAKGEPWKEPDLLSFILKILATLGIPFGVASGKIKREKAAMVTAREQHQADNYLVDDSLVLTTSTDNFVNTTLMATPIPKHESSSDSDGFGGGGWGGGGGGGFSSSGGGKF